MREEHEVVVLVARVELEVVSLICNKKVMHLVLESKLSVKVSLKPLNRLSESL